MSFSGTGVLRDRASCFSSKPIPGRRDSGRYKHPFQGPSRAIDDLPSGRRTIRNKFLLGILLRKCTGPGSFLFREQHPFPSRLLLLISLEQILRVGNRVPGLDVDLPFGQSSRKPDGWPAFPWPGKVSGRTDLDGSLLLQYESRLWTLAGDRAFLMKIRGRCSRRPRRSFRLQFLAYGFDPGRPIQAPTGSTLGSRVDTATLALTPGPTTP